MLVSIIAAMDRNRLIGNKNQLPWHLPADLAHFKRLTMGKPILMGRKTFESIGRPLPGRTNIILSRSRDFAAEGILIASTLKQALDYAAGAEELVVIGGSSLYRLVMPSADRMYLTLIDAAFEGDTWFPEYDLRQWRLVSAEQHSADPKNASDFCFRTYERKKPQID